MTDEVKNSLNSFLAPIPAQFDIYATQCRQHQQLITNSDYKRNENEMCIEQIEDVCGCDLVV